MKIKYLSNYRVNVYVNPGLTITRFLSVAVYDHLLHFIEHKGQLGY